MFIIFDGVTEFIVELIRSNGIFAVVLGVIIETIIVPIPSPIILMTAGAILVESSISLSSIFQIFYISLIAGFAQTIGSYLLYGFSFWLGKPFINKFEKIHGVSWKEILEFQKKFKKRGENLTIFLLRAIPIMPLSIVSGLCGLMKVNFKDYTLYTFLGTIPRNIILVFLGWSLKETYQIFAEHIDGMESIMTLFIIALVLLYIFLNKSGILWKIRKNFLN